MSDTVIEVQGLGKRYRIGVRPERHATRGGRLRQALGAPLRYLAGALREPTDEETLWALKDVSFEVKRGECLGIIGPNGAGKSTLLKILSRITDPTEGRARVRGRVGSLLDVGTGFHPELTGRENIYLNGAILGMTKAEIDRKFDEILAFAEVERFIDTPVKRYSSGMYVRLAFAVAAHLEPEILLVDEVLAVGDAAFQKKCLGKMDDVTHEGRTILFVSHSMAAVNALCQNAIVMCSGSVSFQGNVAQAIQEHICGGATAGAVADLSRSRSRRGTGDMRIVAFWLEDAAGMTSPVVQSGRPCTFVLRCETRRSGRHSAVAATVTVMTTTGVRIFYHHNLLTGQPFEDVGGTVEFRLHMSRLCLPPGSYLAEINLSRDRGMTVIDAPAETVPFEVAEGDFFGTGFQYRGGWNAVVIADGTWSMRPVSVKPEDPLKEG